MLYCLYLIGQVLNRQAYKIISTHLTMRYTTHGGVLLVEDGDDCACEDVFDGTCGDPIVKAVMEFIRIVAPATFAILIVCGLFGSRPAMKKR
jgi:hypothetical protein